MTARMIAELAASALKVVQGGSAYVVAAGALLAVFGGKRSTAALERWRDAFWRAASYPFQARQRDRGELAAFREQTIARSEAILAELRPNGGASLRDSMTRVETRLASALGRVDLIMSAVGTVAAYETDPEGLCVWTSPAYCELAGRPAADLLGWGWIVALHHDDADHVRDCWRSSVDDRRAFEMRFRLVRPDGTPVPVLSRATPLFAGHRLIGWSGLMKAEEQVA